MNGKKIILIGFMIAAIPTLSGCISSPIESAPQEEYDIVHQGFSDTSELLNMGLTQILNVSGETFKLMTEYTCDSASKREWRVTSDKFLYLKVYTEGLSDDTKVYIDNIHIDTSIKSEYASMDGIVQDTMDDRVHNSQMIGFPIGNEIYYYGVNAIEGCNKDFISGTFFGYSGYSVGTVEQVRYTEEDYQKMKVNYNKFQIVYDLLIQGPNDLTPRNVSVSTDFLVPICTKPIEYVNKNGEKVDSHGRVLK